MGLSPSTLFHLTKKKSSLKGILKDNFKVKYCFEEIEHIDKPVEIAIPMVSFCDIKISEIKDHIGKYGSYGIGLSKEWAIENNLNPVIYMNSGSNLCVDYITSIRNLRKKIEENNLDTDNYFKLANIIRYTKKYEGTLIRNEETIENYRFADEREWRYVPEMKQNRGFKYWLSKEEYNTTDKKVTSNRKLKDELLCFNANQILYIIVETEDEINEIISYIRDVKGMNYTMGEVDRLTTRILSCERILNDF